MYKQIIFYLTKRCLVLLEENPNQDFRRLLDKGTDALSSLVDFSLTKWSYLVKGYQIIPMPYSKRHEIENIILENVNSTIL